MSPHSSPHVFDLLYYTLFSVWTIPSQKLPDIQPIEDARVLLNLGDSVTTDHISPAGSIARNSPAARYLAARGYVPHQHCMLDVNTLFYPHFLGI